VEEEQKQENLEITSAFSSSFTFCPVFFFYSYCTSNIRDGEFPGCLMDADLKELNEIPSNVENYFVAEFYFVERNQDIYYQDYELREDTSGYKNPRNLYYGDTDLGPDALIVRDRDFIQLRHPFPFYVRTYQGFPVLKRKKPKVVKKLDDGLHEYYTRVRLR